MPRTPTRIVGPALVATGPTTVYTAAALTKVVTRRIHVQNPSGSPVTFTLTIGADAAGTRILGAYSIAAGGVYIEYGPMTMEAAEIITVSAGTNNILVLTIDADVYTLG